MSSRSRMIHRATLLQNTGGGIGDAGQELPPTWATVDASLPCYVWSKSRIELMNSDRTAIVDDLRMLVPVGTTVSASYRVQDVKTRDGDTYLSGVLEVKGVQRRRDHKELLLQAVTSG